MRKKKRSSFWRAAFESTETIGVEETSPMIEISMLHCKNFDIDVDRRAFISLNTIKNN